MSTFYNEKKNREKFFKLDSVQAADSMVANIPQVVMLPTLLGPVFADENKTAWELYKIVKAWLAPLDIAIADSVMLICNWLLLSSFQGRSKDTSATEIKIIAVVTLLT